MPEKKMGNRGSKWKFINFLKEQWADGSYVKFKNLKILTLRCALMGYEKNYQVNILSKQLNKILRSFSSLVRISKLNPWFVTGFSDGEASFGISISIDKRQKGKIGWAVKASFQISLNSKDLNLLLKFQDFFKCGRIVNKKTRNES